MAGIDSQHPIIVSTLLNDQSGQSKGSDHFPVGFKVLELQAPAPCGVLSLRIQPKGHEKKPGLEFNDPPQCLSERVPIVFPVNVFRQGDVHIIISACTDPGFVFEPAEIRECKARVSMNREGQHVGPVIKDVLSPVAVMVV